MISFPFPGLFGCRRLSLIHISMSDGDFIDNISNINSFEKTELYLYFADSTGQKLVKERREVVHNVNTSMEKLVIEELIEGPGRPGINPTLPPETQLLNVSVNENVCYIRCV